MGRGQSGDQEARLQKVRRSADERLSSLQEYALALTHAHDTSQVATVVMAEGRNTVGAIAGAVCLLTPDNPGNQAASEFCIMASTGYDRSFLPGAILVYSDSENHSLLEAVRSRMPVLLETSPDQWVCYPEHDAALSYLHDKGALAVVPLLVENRSIGCLLFSFSEETHFTTEDRTCLNVVAAMGATALDRSRLQEVRQAEAVARRIAEEALQQATMQARCFFDANVVGMIHWNLDTSLITDANDAFLEMVGYTREDVARGLLNFREMTPPEWSDRNERGVADIRAHGGALPYEKEYFRKDGSRVPILIGGTRFEGSSSSGASVIVDLSAQKQAEAEQTRTFALFEQVFEYSSVGLCLTDKQGCFVRVNPAFARILGHDPGELEGLPYTAVLRPDDNKEIGTPFNAQSDGKNPEENVLLIRTRSGVSRWLRCSPSVPLNVYGEPLQLTSVIDITEPKEQQDRIAVLNARLQRAITEGHHRIKNNLQVLSALVEFQVTESDVVPVSSMHRIHQNIRTLAALHDLLTVDARTNDSPSETISLRAALEKLLGILQGVGSGRHIAITQVDEVRLSAKHCGTFTLLVNEIIQNAVKHGKGLIEIAVTMRDGNIRLEVSDSGPGFPDGFNPEQAANTGLELIESMARWDLQGETRYENRSTGGARVVVTFPIPE